MFGPFPAQKRYTTTTTLHDPCLEDRNQCPQVLTKSMRGEVFTKSMRICKNIVRMARFPPLHSWMSQVTSINRDRQATAKYFLQPLDMQYMFPGILEPLGSFSLFFATGSHISQPRLTLALSAQPRSHLTMARLPQVQKDHFGLERNHSLRVGVLKVSQQCSEMEIERSSRIMGVSDFININPLMDS